MLDHRVVTLHPKIHGGLLADRGKATHRADLETHGILPFDLVVSNLYPFLDRPDIETIDIGGPAMTRAAAKNHAWVTIVTSPRPVRRRCSRSCAPTTAPSATRRAARSRSRRSRAPPRTTPRSSQWLQARRAASRARRARARPHRRDAALRREPAPARGALPPARHHELVGRRAAARRPRALVPQLLRRRRRVEARARPRRRARRARSSSTPTRAASCVDDDLADRVPARARVRRALGVRRHRRAQPAGRRRDGRAHGRRPAGRRRDRARLRSRARSRRCRSGARTRASSRRRRPSAETLDVRQISGGFLVQDAAPLRGRRATTGASSPRSRPTDEQWRDVELAWRICGHVKSNAIVLVKDGQAVGIGAGQQNRVESGEIAAKKAAGRARGGACASDAFYPFPDGIEAAAAAGVAAVIQPGGAMRDEADHREGRRARPRDGVHRRTALPALSADRSMPGGTGRRGDVRRPRAADRAARRARASRPGLGTILVGDDGASARLHPHEAGEGARSSGSRRRTCTCPRTRRRPTCSPRSARSTTIPRVDAMLVQHPTPPQIDYEAALLEIDPDKDVDGCTR